MTAVLTSTARTAYPLVHTDISKPAPIPRKTDYDPNFC